MIIHNKVFLWKVLNPPKTKRKPQWFSTGKKYFVTSLMDVTSSSSSSSSSSLTTLGVRPKRKLSSDSSMAHSVVKGLQSNLNIKKWQKARLLIKIFFYSIKQSSFFPELQVRPDEGDGERGEEDGREDENGQSCRLKKQNNSIKLCKFVIYNYNSRHLRSLYPWFWLSAGFKISINRRQ